MPKNPSLYAKKDRISMPQTLHYCLHIFIGFKFKYRSICREKIKYICYFEIYEYIYASFDNFAIVLVSLK